MAHAPFAAVLRHVLRRVAPRTADQGDGELLHRFVHDHEQAAFTALVQRHGPMVLGVCRRVLGDAHDADDAFQATFLVLVRKAPSLRQWGSLGNWLYTVAYHLALRARGQLARRHAQERQVEAMPSPAAEGAPAWHELRPVLDAELDRLPARYREPVVLCYLQGKTNEEAARELGCPVGTVKCRLSRARDVLRNRLERRGLALSVGALAPGLVEQASAAVSPALLDKVTEAATPFAAGNALAASAVSLRAVALAEGVLRTMFTNSLKTVTAVLLALGLIGTGAGALWSRSAESSPNADESSLVAAADEAQVKAGDAAAAKGAKSDDAGRRPQFRKKLNQRITLENGIEANTPLKDALEFLTKQYGVTFIIDQNAFNSIGVQKVEEQTVELPKMKDVRLSTVLRMLLSQIKGDRYSGAFLLRPEHIEVTTTYHQWGEALGGLDPGPILLGEDEEEAGGLAAPQPGPMKPAAKPALIRRLTPVVQVDYDRQSLTDVLRELAGETGIDIVIDPRVAEKARNPVSLTVYNALLDTVLNLLTDTADLDWVWVDKVMYVTTKENAKAKREKALEQLKSAPGRQKPLLPAPMPPQGA